MSKIVSVRNAHRRVELKFQGLIIDSYKRQGGMAKKWATDLQVGVPDLVCSFPAFGVHLMEVKHRPEWQAGGTYANPLDAIQDKRAKEYIDAGGLVIGAVVIQSAYALGSWLSLFHPLDTSISMVEGQLWPYRAGLRYDVYNAVYRHVSATVSLPSSRVI